MKERHKESYANKDDSGRFRDFFNQGKKAGVKFWKCKEDDHELYIVPYIVGSQHPRLKEGKIDFVLDIFIHRAVGINEDSFICLNRTFKEKCPICDHQAELRNGEENVDEATLKALNPTRRNIFNIVCLDSPKEEEKGVQVWDVSQWLFTNHLEELAHKKRGGGEVAYADIDEGKVISFRRKGSGMTTELTAFEFKDREDIPEEILDAAHSLDELIHVPTYEEVSEAYWATAKETKTEEEEAPRKEKAGKKPVDEEETPRKEKAGNKPVDEEVPEDPSEPSEECPYGAVFGKEYKEYEECSSCENKAACREKNVELKATEAPPEKKKLTRRAK
jgi:hypothetical protein